MMKIRKLVSAFALLCLPSFAAAEITVADQTKLCSSKVNEEAVTSQQLHGITAKTLQPEITDGNINKCGCTSCNSNSTYGASGPLAPGCCAGGGTSGCGCLQPWTSICKIGCGNGFCGGGLSGLSGLFGGGAKDNGCGACGDCAPAKPSGSCCSDCLCCYDQWTFIGETLFLTRTSADDLTLISDQTTGAELLNARGFDFDYNVAPRIFLRRDTAKCWGVEIGYMGLDSWNDQQFRGDPISPILFGPGEFPFPSSAPGTIVGAAYGSEFHSAEINLRRRCNECTTWVVGARMIDFSDTIVAGTVAPIAEEFFTIDADNHLYGFHVGFDTELVNCGGQFHVDALLRAGLMFNDADQTTRVPVLAGVPAGLVATNVSAEDDHTAFVGELGLRGMYELTNSLAVGVGYHLIWLEGVALAPDQIPVSSLIGSGDAVLDTGGNLLFHGAVLSVNASY